MYCQSIKVDGLDVVELKKSLMCLYDIIDNSKYKNVILDKSKILNRFNLPDFKNELENSENIEKFIQVFFNTFSDINKKTLLFFFLFAKNEHNNINKFSINNMLKSRYSFLLKNTNINEKIVKDLEDGLEYLKFVELEKIHHFLKIEISIKSYKTLKNADSLSTQTSFEEQYIMESQWLNDLDKKVLREQWRNCLKDTVKNFKYLLISVFFVRYGLDRFNASLNYFFTKDEIKDLLLSFKEKLNIPANIANEESFNFAVGLGKVNMFFKANNVSLFNEMDIKTLNKKCSKIIVFNENLSKQGNFNRIELNINLMRNLKEIDIINANVFKENSVIFKNYTAEVLSKVISVISKVKLSDISISHVFNEKGETSVNVMNTNKVILFFIEDKVNFKDVNDIESVQDFIFKFAFNFVPSLTINVNSKNEYEKFQSQQEFHVMKNQLGENKCIETLNIKKVRKF